MSTPMSEYYESLDPTSQARLHEIISTWKGLGVIGCNDCKIPAIVATVTDGEADSFVKGNSIGQLVHYAIELNGLKRPTGQPLQTANLDDFEEDALLGIAARIGLDEEATDRLSQEFKVCIRCPGAFELVGSTPSFEEALTILESER